MSNTMPDTMAEAFCEEYLTTWTEHGQVLTSWLHKDISTRSNRMSRAGAINLFHPMDYGRLLIVTVFPDRSWIVHHEPTGGAPPMVGTREDERRIPHLIHILDFIHPTLRVPPPKSRTLHSVPTAPKECPNGPGWSPLFPQRPTCFFTSPAGLIDTGPKAQNGVGLKVT